MSPQAQVHRSSRPPQRQLSLFRNAGLVFAASPTDRLIGDYRCARDAVRGWHALDAAARAKLGQVNGHDPKWRRQSQSGMTQHCCYQPQSKRDA